MIYCTSILGYLRRGRQLVYLPLAVALTAIYLIQARLKEDMVKTCLSLWQNIQFLVLTKIYLWALPNQSHVLFVYRVIWIRTNLFVRGGGGGGVPSFLFRPRGCCCCGSCCCCCCCCCCRDVTWWWCAGRLTGPNRLVSTSPSLSLSSPSLSSSSSSCSSLAAFQSYN